MVHDTRLFAAMIAIASLGWACSSRPGGTGTPVTGGGGSTASGTSSGSGGSAAGPASGSGGSSVSGGPVTTDGGLPAACPASAAGDTPTGTDTTSPQSTTSFTYTNVGGAGAYDKVVDGWSEATGCVSDPNGMLCDTKYRMPVQVSGPMTPFDEDLSMIFAGPIELYQLAVYTPSAPSGGAFQQAAYWDRCTARRAWQFVGNKSWYECAGFVESYVTADGTAKSATPVQFAGSIAGGHPRVNVMSDAMCTGGDCGWSSGIPFKGFSGDAAGSKIFVTKLRMPISTQHSGLLDPPGAGDAQLIVRLQLPRGGVRRDLQGRLRRARRGGGHRRGGDDAAASTSIYSYQSCTLAASASGIAR